MAIIKKVEAKHLDRIITIQRYTKQRDAYGEEIPTWADWRTVRAGLQPEDVKKQEKDYYEEQLVAVSVTVYVTRFFVIPNIPNTQMRVIDEYGRIYDVERVNEIGRRNGWEFKCRRKE